MLIALITITIILLVLMGRGKRAPRPIPPGLIRPAPPPGPPRVEIQEGRFIKGGRNVRPSCPRPPVQPKGQGPHIPTTNPPPVEKKVEVICLILKTS